MFYPPSADGKLALGDLDRLLANLSQGECCIDGIQTYAKGSKTEEISSCTRWLSQLDVSMFRGMVMTSTGQDPNDDDSSNLQMIRHAPSPLDCPICGRRFSRRDVRIRHQKESCSQSRGAQGDILCPYPACKRSRPGNGFKRRWHLRQHFYHCDLHKLELAGNAGSSSEQVENTPAVSGYGRKRQAGEAASLGAADVPDGENEGSNAVSRDSGRSELEATCRDLAMELEAVEEDLRRKRLRLEGLEARIRRSDA